MLIPELNLEISVDSAEGAERLSSSEPGRWSVISIHGRFERKAHHPRARTVEHFLFDDVIRDYPGQEMIVPTVDHARRVLKAILRFEGSPLLVHCAYGISRSPAAALAALYWHALRKQIPDPVTASLTWMKEIRKDFRPNLRLARLLIEEIQPQAVKPFELFRKHPLWPVYPETDFYSRFLPKPSRDLGTAQNEIT
jgi:predicted protein tyrosine phosphatase